LWMKTYVLGRGLDDRAPPGMKVFIGGLIHGWRCWLYEDRQPCADQVRVYLYHREHGRKGYLFGGI